jgi:hypothetical protein
MFIVSFMLLLLNMQSILLYMMWLQNTSMLLFFAAAIFAAIIYMYFLGILIANIYATYRRAIGMNIPKWKALLSLPFGLSLLWFPGYFLNDEKSKPAIAIKSKWYSGFTNWVVAKPLNATLVFAVTVLLTTLFFDIYSAFILILCAIFFGVWVLVLGAGQLRKNVGGVYASVAAVINIALIVSMIFRIAVFTPNATIETMTVETIQLAETKE